MDQTGLENRGLLRLSSYLRVRTKQMIRDDKLIEVEPGKFRLSEWYRTDLELRRRVPGIMTKERVIAMLEEEPCFKKEG